MKLRHIAAWPVGVALALGGVAHAQSTGDSADELIRDANAITAQLDAGKYDEIWNNAADFVKARYSEAQFTNNLRQSHDRIGPVHRSWGSVVRVRYTGAKDLPDGLYANVDLVGDKVGGGTVYEKLSFRLEQDGQWHLTGYVPRDNRGNSL